MILICAKLDHETLWLAKHTITGLPYLAYKYDNAQQFESFSSAMQAFDDFTESDDYLNKEYTDWSYLVKGEL